MNNDFKVKILRLAAQICDMYGDKMANAIYQDWDEDEKLLEAFSEEEQEAIARGYQDWNSQGDDYVEGEGIGRDAMMISYYMHYWLNRLADQEN